MLITRPTLKNLMGGFLAGSVIKYPPANAGDMGSVPGSGRSHMTNLASILKSKDITSLTKVRIVKAMVSPAIMYGC